MGGCFFMLAVLFFIIGVVQLFAPERGQVGGQGAGMPGGLLGGLLGGQQRDIPGTARSQRVEPFAPAGAPGGQAMNSTPQKLNWVRLGERIYVPHPVRGETMAHVLGKIVYSELWQTRRGPQSPWVPTGNSFLGFWLEGGLFLLNWQNRFYLLDEMVELSDADIQRDFLPYARQFAQSDQQATVHFSWPPAMWKIEDIGKFRVETVEGEGLRFQPGAVGRFIHSSGDSGRALVVEDYEGGGGGQDTAWVGYSVEEEGIKQA